MIRFTQPLVFNDPFEANPHLFDDYTVAEWQRIGEKEAQSMGLDSALVDKILSPDAFAARRPRAFQILLDLLQTSIGVLSLSEEPASLLMWAHYAMTHTGYLIGFDSSHPFFGSGNKRQSRVNELCKVHYLQTRPSRSLRNLSLIDTYFTKSREWSYEREWSS